MKIKYLLPVLIIALSFIGTAIFPLQANAATLYDDVKPLDETQSATSWTLSSPNCTPNYETAEQLFSFTGDPEDWLVNNYGFTDRTDMITKLDNVIANGQYVMFYAGAGDAIGQVSIFWVEDGGTLTLEFTGAPSSPGLRLTGYTGTPHYTIITSRVWAYNLGYTGAPSGGNNCDKVMASGDSSISGFLSGITGDGQTIIGTADQLYSLGFKTEPIDYPSGYEGPIYPNENISNKTVVYPGMSVIVEDDPSTDNSKVKLIFADSWADFLANNNLRPPDYSIFTLTDMDDNVIVSDRCWGPTGCDWNALPLGSYKARLDVIYLSDTVNNLYEFKTTEVWFEVNNTSYTMLYYPKEAKYCTIRNGFEWNCTIPQPGDDPSLITGDPEVWVEAECTLEEFPWINLGNCINNGLHYLGEYLGINGPQISPGASPFFQFDTNTFGLTAILTAPIAILNNLATAEYTCTTVELPLPYVDDNLPLPCMQSYYTTYLGELYTLWQTVINGIVSYWVIVGLLRMVKEAKDPQKDSIEVLKL